MTTNPVTKAREKTGTPRATAARNAGISHQVLRNLEEVDGATRATNPLDCKLGTILAIHEQFWPHLQLKDLVPGTKFKLVPIDTTVGRQMRRRAGKPPG